MAFHNVPGISDRLLGYYKSRGVHLFVCFQHTDLSHEMAFYHQSVALQAVKNIYLLAAWFKLATERNVKINKTGVCFIVDKEQQIVGSGPRSSYMYK